MKKEKERVNIKGQLLVEAILAIALIGVLAGIIGMAVSSSTQSNKASGKKTVAVALAQEAFEALKAIRDNNETTGRGWNKIYLLNKGSGNLYYPANTAGLCGSAKWCLLSGSEPVVKDGVTYTRSLYIDNVCRDARNGGGDISAVGTCNETTNFSDPSTQKITITITASGMSTVDVQEYIARSANNTNSWDTDTEFKAAGSACSNTKVIGTGSAADVELSSGSGC